MQKIWNKGQRIRANDKYLVYHFSIGTLLFVFGAVLLLSNIKQLKCTDWENFNLLENDLTFSIYNFITIGIATGILIRKKAVNPKTNCFVCIDMKLSKLKFTILIVTSANQLVEKIQIFDAGKDDRVMELVKLLATDSILKNDPDIEFDELRFAVDDDGTNILVIINKGEITGAVDIDNMYEFASSHCDDFKDLRDDEDIVINREWILNKLAETEN